MTEATPGSRARPAGPSRGAPSLRALGALILVLFLLTSAAGGSLAAESSYLLVTLASHVGLALATIAVCLYGSAVASRPYKVRIRYLARIAGLCAGVATLGGTDVLLFGPDEVALAVMSGSALAGIVASALMVLLGGPSGRVATSARPT